MTRLEWCGEILWKITGKRRAPADPEAYQHWLKRHEGVAELERMMALMAGESDPMKVTYCDICTAVADRAYSLRVGGQNVSVVIEGNYIHEYLAASGCSWGVCADLSDRVYIVPPPLHPKPGCLSACLQLSARLSAGVSRQGTHVYNSLIEDFEICEPCRASLLEFLRERRKASEPVSHLVRFAKELPSS